VIQHYRDERVIERGDRLIGYLGPWASCLTLAWLASHRNRLRMLTFGGHKLSVLIMWDTKGRTRVNRTPAQDEAIRTLIGPAPDPNPKRR
jgi:hypothetical protein